jgi:hypothetical protein
MRGEDEGDLTNIQHKPNQNCHYKSPPSYNKYILIKIYNKKEEIYFTFCGAGD